MTETKFPHLFQFFSGYFHEDWELDDPHPLAVVSRYLREAKPSIIEETLKEITTLKAMNLSEIELNQVLMNELYCSYDPSFEGKTSAEWLEWLQNTIQQKLKQLVILT